MVFSNIKSRKQERGFTIVELLIVIVVIGILAGITIVAYSGITARSKNSSALGNVQSVLSVAEAYNADTGAYPSSAAQFQSGAPTNPSSHLPTGVTLVKPGGTTLALMTTTAGATLTANNLMFTGATQPIQSVIGVSTVVTTGVVTGGVIIFWDSQTSQISTTYTYYGNGAAGSTFTPLT